MLALRFIQKKIILHVAGHMTLMATMSIYGINPLKIFFPGISRPILKKLGLKHQRLKLIIFCSNDNPGLTLTYFSAWSNFAT